MESLRERDPVFKQMYALHSFVVNGPGSMPITAGESNHANGLLVPDGTIVGREWQAQNPSFLLSNEIQREGWSPKSLEFFLFNEAVMQSREDPALPTWKPLGGVELLWEFRYDGNPIHQYGVDINLNQRLIELILFDDIPEGHSWRDSSEMLSAETEKFSEIVKHVLYEEGLSNTPPRMYETQVLMLPASANMHQALAETLSKVH